VVAIAASMAAHCTNTRWKPSRRQFGAKTHIIESPDSHDVHNPRDASVECHQQHKRAFNAQFMNSFTGCVLSTVPVIVVNGKRHSACEVWSAAHCQKIRGNNHWQTGAAPGHPLHEHRSFAGFWCFWAVTLRSQGHGWSFAGHEVTSAGMTCQQSVLWLAPLFFTPVRR